MDLLVDLRLTIQSFRTGINYAARPLGELIAENRDSRFCRLAVREPCFPSRPKAALEEAGKKLLREPADLELYLGFVRGLGSSDVQGQMEHMELYSALLQTSIAQAGAVRESRSRLCVCLGLFGGVTLCLVLL